MEPRRIALALAVCGALQIAAVATRSGGETGGRAELLRGRQGMLTPAQVAGAVPGTPPGAAPSGVKVVRTPTGMLVSVLGERDGQWLVLTPCGREATVPAAQPVDRVTVVLDPGHGGYDPGAVGPNGLHESELNLAVAKHTATALRTAGVSVVLTRQSDHGMELAPRARLAVDLGASVFVSVHHNAGAQTPSERPGSEAYHQVDSEPSRRLAGLIWEESVRVLSAYDIEWVHVPDIGVTWRTNSRDEDWYAMLRLPRPVTAALSEFAYLSNPPEAALLADPRVQRAEAEALARAILRFLTTDDQGSGFTPGGRMAPRGPSGLDPQACDDPPLR